jgi:HEAT repeat protein
MVASALGLHFLTVAVIVLSRTYVDLLFLSSYPRDWLPYLFLGQTGATLLFSFGLTPLLRGSSLGRALALLALFAASLIAARFVVGPGLPGSAFALCVWLGLLGVLLGVLSWNAVGDAFDVRQFKRLAKWVNAAGAVGAVVVGALTPPLLALLRSESLLLVLAGLTAAAGLCLPLLPPLPSPPARGRAAGTRSPFSYPLFTQLAAAACLLMLVDTLTDYALKLELQASYDKAGIGRFMGPFYGISSALTLAVQFGASGALLRVFGVAGLLAPLPLFCLGASGVLAARPGLWTAALLRLGENVGRYSLDNLGREIAARPLPSAIRGAGKLYLKGIAMPVGCGVGAVFLWLTASRVGLRGVAFLALGACALWTLLVTRTRGAYQRALEEAVGMGRLTGAVDVRELAEAGLAPEVGRGVAEHALANPEPDTQVFGLRLLEEVGAGEAPRGLLAALEAEQATVRAAAARAARSFAAGSVVPALLARLAREPDPAVSWQLLEALANVGPEAALAAAGELLESELPQLRAGAVLVLLAAGDLDAIIRAAVTLREMLRSDDPAMRLGAARAIGALRAGRLTAELGRLLEDGDPAVRLEALRAVAARRAVELVAQVARSLGGGRLSYQAGQTLLALGEPAAEELERVAREGRPAAARAALRTLAQLPGSAVEAQLARLIPAVDVATRTVLARETAQRARRLAVSERLREVALGESEREARTLALLARSPEPALEAELRSRRRMAQERMLCWLAVAGRAGEVLALAPALDAERPGATRSAALELLENLVERRLRPLLGALEGRASAGAGDATLDTLDDPFLGWLRRGLANREPVVGGGGQAAMDVVQKVMLLRRVNLFSGLPGEILLTVAEACEVREFVAGERFFSEGDAPDGLYVIAAGRVRIQKGKQTLAELATTELFGEVALLDDDPRMADAVAESDGLLLYMDREVFRRVTEDLPEVLRAVIRTLIQYLKHAEKNLGRQTMF